jgi:diketogulonate reductase-like aldo/keto reductase
MAKLAAPGGFTEIFNLPRSNGVKIPQLGFGTYQIPPGRETEAAVSVALREGYRHIDTAALYGNERDVGKGLLHIDCCFLWRSC